jgi:hypothetical protein
MFVWTQYVADLKDVGSDSSLDPYPLGSAHGWA